MTTGSIQVKYILLVIGGSFLHPYSFCRRESNRIKGAPFCPIKAIPVDLFPHTKHCELVILLERVNLKALGSLPSEPSDTQIS